MSDYELIKSNKVYSGKILDVVQDIIRLPNGRETMREIAISHVNASVIIPIDAQGKIIFVRQYRHAARGIVLEIPAGTMDSGESPLDCANRELEEEIGYKAGNMRFINKMYTSIGFCSQMVHIYLAENLIEGEQKLDEDEFITIERYSLYEAMDMIFTGGIIDSETIVGILAYKQILNER